MGMLISRRHRATEAEKTKKSEAPEISKKGGEKPEDPEKRTRRKR